jgi:prepilin-type N-terminal cleavage/methylation domain-containing protein
MKTTTQQKSFGTLAFTLIELLTVIAIIAILAAIILPVLSVATTHAKKTRAATEIAQIVSGIQQYESQYSRMPVSPAVQSSGLPNVTYGGVFNNKAGQKWPPVSTYFVPGATTGNYVPSNTDVMAILMNFTNYPGTTTWTINTNYQKNPQQTVFLKAAPSGNTTAPGYGTDLNYRDPWGNPYIITMDLNEDDKAEDMFYSSPTVSSVTHITGGTALVGLICQPKANGGDGYYIYHGNVMVWSMGPDGPVNSAPSSFDTNSLATDGPNKQHILSWQQ